MSDKKKKALGFLITGVVFIIAGIATWAMEAPPTWMTTLIVVVGGIAAALGLSITLPEL